MTLRELERAMRKLSRMRKSLEIQQAINDDLDEFSKGKSRHEEYIKRLKRELDEFLDSEI